MVWRIDLRALIIVALLWASSLSARADSFLDLIRRGDLASITRTLQGHPELAKATAGDGNTPLHVAAESGQVEIARMLLNYGADINAKGRRQDQWSPLQCAADTGHFDVAQLLVNDGANVMARAHDGFTPFQQAVWRGDLAIMRLLLEHNADMVAQCDDGATPIHSAARCDQIVSICFLVARGVSIDLPDRDGNAPLAVAAFCGHPDVEQFLISAGADIGHQNKLGQTALDIAIKRKDAGCIGVFARYQSYLDMNTAREEARRHFGVRVHSGYATWTDPKARTHVAYTNDFQEDSVGPEWSISPLGGDYTPLHISITPEGARRFLGDFDSQSVRLMLKNLPEHTEAAVTCDLYILRAWRGNDGPHLWRVGLIEGPTLLQTTFSNYLPVITPALKTQAFPGEYPGDHNPLQSGASEKNTLGYSVRMDNQNVPMDAVYKIKLTFSHSGSVLLLDFAASGLPHLAEASWGLAHIEVSVGTSASPAPSGTGHGAVKPRSPATGARHKRSGAGGG